MFIVDKKTMAEAERLADSRGIDYYNLMHRAGCAAAEHIIRACDPADNTFLILCGRGNNGGDGYVIARVLHMCGAKVFLCMAEGIPATDLARRAFKQLPSELQFVLACDVISAFSSGEGAPFNPDDTIVIDAVYGTGFHGELSDTVSALFRAVGKSSFAVDIPSGLYCDGGAGAKDALPTECTLTFGAVKLCSVLPPSNELSGKTVCLDIGIDDDTLLEAGAYLRAVSPVPLPLRPKNAHKNSVGVLLAVTGSFGMPGAAVISAKAALRSGIGILRQACIRENYTIFGTSLPEAVLLPLSAKGKTFSRTAILPLKEELKRSDALLIGPGLGISEDVRLVVKELLSAAEIPVVLDADGINLIADDIEFLKEVKADLILTPHPGEMARLTGKTVTEIENDRIGTAQSFAKEYGVTLVLKGANTVISDKDGNLRVNLGGDPAMATAGSGDMLAGVMATMLAKGLTPLMAAEQAVWLHSAAGELARAELGENAVLPTDMIELMHKTEGYDPLVYGAFRPLP